jgi:small subunit ribosomal protein S9
MEAKNMHNTGRRKTSIARVYLKEGKGNITINGKRPEAYFGHETSRNAVRKPFELTETVDKYDVKVNVKGGGPTGQAGAISLAIAKTLVGLHPEYHKTLKDEGLLRRDPRMVERKKYGKRKARKTAQFSKR